jgi:hypothetical protein
MHTGPPKHRRPVARLFRVDVMCTLKYSMASGAYHHVGV